MQQDGALGLFKLSKRGHIEEFVSDGHLFMTPLAYFRKREADILRSDKHDGATAAHDLSTNVRFRANGSLFGDLEEIPDVLTIEPQADLGEYRVDLLLTYREGLPFNRKVKLTDGTEIRSVKDVTVHLIVESDGHDLHDRSKEQASRVKKLGYEVFGHRAVRCKAN